MLLFRERLAIGKFPERLLGLINGHKAKFPTAPFFDDPEDFSENKMYLITWFDSCAMGELLQNTAVFSQGQVRSMIYQLTSGLADLEFVAEGEIRNLVPMNILVQKVSMQIFNDLLIVLPVIKSY